MRPFLMIYVQNIIKKLHAGTIKEFRCSSKLLPYFQHFNSESKPRLNDLIITHVISQEYTAIGYRQQIFPSRLVQYFNSGRLDMDKLISSYNSYNHDEERIIRDLFNSSDKSVKLNIAKSLIKSHIYDKYGPLRQPIIRKHYYVVTTE